MSELLFAAVLAYCGAASCHFPAWGEGYVIAVHTNYTCALFTEANGAVSLRHYIASHGQFASTPCIEAVKATQEPTP